MLGERIMLLRRGSGWSQTELAKQLHISPSAVGMYEQGRREPSLQALVELAAVFGVSTDYLLKDNLEQTELTQESAADSSSRTISMESTPQASSV